MLNIFILNKKTLEKLNHLQNVKNHSKKYSFNGFGQIRDNNKKKIIGFAFNRSH